MFSLRSLCFLSEEDQVSGSRAKQAKIVVVGGWKLEIGCKEGDLILNF